MFSKPKFTISSLEFPKKKCFRLRPGIQEYNVEYITQFPAEPSLMMDMRSWTRDTLAKRKVTMGMAVLIGFYAAVIVVSFSVSSFMNSKLEVASNYDYSTFTNLQVPTSLESNDIFYNYADGEITQYAVWYPGEKDQEIKFIPLMGLDELQTTCGTGQDQACQIRVMTYAEALFMAVVSYIDLFVVEEKFHKEIFLVYSEK